MHKVDTREQVEAVRKLVAFLHSHRNCDLWQQACVKPNIPPTRRRADMLTTCEHDSYGELSIDAKDIDGTVSRSPSTNLGDQPLWCCLQSPGEGFEEAG